MDFLLDNPLATMDAYAFLALFASLIIFVSIAVGAVRYTSDRSDRLNIPAIPPNPDPVEIAYLRGGPNEAVRAVIFSLLQKHLIHIETDARRPLLKPTTPGGSVTGLAEIEQTALEWIGGAREARDVFRKDGGLVGRLWLPLSAYQGSLESRQLLTSEESLSHIKRFARTAAVLIALFGGYKVAVSLLYGNFNFVFTIFLAAVGIGVVLAIGKLPRMTRLGKLYLDRLYLAFRDIKFKSQRPYLKNAAEPVPTRPATVAGVDPLLLSVGLFGSSILAGTVFGTYNTAFQRAQQEEGKRATDSGSGGCGSGACGSCSSDSGGGSSCSSGGGCSSGCGGGGCGGGCGG